MTRSRPRRWVGIDGEGVGRSPHRYVLLAGSDEAGEQFFVENPDGLTTRQCLSFLLDTYANRDVRICGYFLGYDWTKILSDLPNKSIFRLFRPELRALPAEEGGGFSWISWRGFRMHWLSGAMHIKRGKQSITVWDIGRFYQQAFVSSLSDWKTIPESDIDAIAAMKTMRDVFTDEQRDEIRRYCLSECRALATLARQLSDAHEAVDIRPAAWHGPGSTAAALLRREGVRDHRGAPPDDHARDAVSRAFFGGRFEHATIGVVPGVWGYDIASAYPYAMTLLPCLRHARWERVRGMAQTRWSLCRTHVRDIGARHWGPLPLRLPSGGITWPRSDAHGWHWSPEVRAALAGWTGVEVEESWALHEECDCTPWQWVLPLYRYRQSLGKEGRGRIVKLALNSCYGQIARSVGGGGAYSSRTWAGMITSVTRGLLLDLLARYDEEIVAVATDGIYARARLDTPAPPLAPDTLGSWEEKFVGRLTLVRPGIYYTEDEEHALVRARGVGRRHLTEQRARISEAIAGGIERVDLGISTGFGGARACVLMMPSGIVRRSELYGEWHAVPARISLAPGPKRAANWAPPSGMGAESAPYRGGISGVARAAAVLELLKDALR